MFRFSVCILGFLASVTAANAQDAQTVNLYYRNANNAQNFTLDLNAPTDPGFVVIGASPKNVTDPGDFKQFAIHTGSFFQNGELKPGLAVSGVPFWWVNRDLTLEQYANFDSVPGGLNSFERILARTQFSLATVGIKDETGKEGIKLGTGLQTQLLDSQDIRRDKRNLVCIDKSWKSLRAEYDHVRSQAFADTVVAIEQDPALDFNEEFERRAGAASSAVLARYDLLYARCKDVAELRFLQQASWIFGFGAAARSHNGNASSLVFTGASFWSTYRSAFGKNMAAILFVKADIDTDFKVTDGQFASANAFEGALALALEELTWKLDATASYHFRDFQNPAFDEDYFQFSATAALKVRDGVWIEATAGTRTNAKFQEQGFALLQLKMDLSDAINAVTR